MSDRDNLRLVTQRVRMELAGTERSRAVVDSVVGRSVAVRLGGAILPAIARSSLAGGVAAGDVVEVERPRGVTGAIQIVGVLRRAVPVIPQPAEGDQDSVLAVADDLSLAWRASPAEAFPVGALFLSVVSTDPAELLGYGTWERIAGGRVLVGQDDEDEDFDTAEQTGGAKTVAAAGTNATEDAHTHETPFIPNGTASIRRISSTVFGSGASRTSVAEAAASSDSNTGNTLLTGPGSSHGHAFTGSATSVVQPYLVVYIWKRTA